MADWVLAGQLTDEKVTFIRDILLPQTPTSDFERKIFKG